MNIVQMRRGMVNRLPIWIERFCTQHQEVDSNILWRLYKNLPSIRASLDPDFAGVYVPYIHRTSGYFLTPYIASSNTNVDFTMRLPAGTTSSNPFVYYNTTALSLMYACIAENSSPQFRFGSSRNKASYGYSDRQWHRVYSNKNVFTMENKGSLTLSNSTFTQTNPMYIFSSSGSGTFDMRNLQFIESGERKMWLIPYKALNSNTGNVEGCFADIVSGIIYFDTTGNGGFDYYNGTE